MIRFGIDFDGTIVLYDALFHRLACEQFAMPGQVEASKPAIRHWFWSQPGGRDQWIELQGLTYGTHMHEASPAPGSREFIRYCAQSGIPVAVISHKTEFPVIGPRVRLRDRSLEWLEFHGLFAEGSGLDRSRVYFESTREEKVRRIAACACTHFIDDLPEVFAEPAFPRAVERWLYAAYGTMDGVRVFRTWNEMHAGLEVLLGK